MTTDAEHCQLHRECLGCIVKLRELYIAKGLYASSSQLADLAERIREAIKS